MLYYLEIASNKGVGMASLTISNLYYYGVGIQLLKQVGDTVKKGDVLASFYGGYNDGINRYLSNTGYVYVNGYRCKIIGRISMDQTTILLDKNIANKTKIGDKVYLYKKDVKNILSGLKEQEIFYMAKHSRRVKQVNN